MDSAARYFVGIGLTAAACLGPGVQRSEAQQPLRIEGIYPRQLPPGETTLVSLVIPSVDDIQAEISPGQGVTLSRVTRGVTFQGAHTWWELAVDLARDVAPSERTLIVRLPGARTTSTSLTIPSHVPRISNLRMVGGRTNAATLDLELSATDAADDLGAAPYIWFMAACGGMPLPGVVRGTVTTPGGSASLVRASLPRPQPGSATAASVRCDLQVRIADSGGFESNTLRTTLDLAN